MLEAKTVADEKKKTWLEQIEANQEKTESVAYHCKWAPHIKASHLLITMQGQTYYIYKESLKK
jgi:hypothetical protein